MGSFDIFRKDLTLIRKSGGSYVDGRWAEGSETQSIIFSGLQPLTPREMQELPEGRRTNQTYKLYSDDQMFTVEDENPDIIVIDGERFEVISSGPYQSNIINHYKTVISKADQGQ